MRVVIIMGFYLSCSRAIVCAVLAGAIVMASASTKGITESVKAMERELGLTIAPPFGALSLSPRPTRPSPDTYISCGALAISPNGTAIAWCLQPYPYRGEKISFLTVKSLKAGEQPVWVEGRIAAGRLGLSSDANIIVALARPLDPHQSGPFELLAIDRRAGVVVHNLTPFVTPFEAGNNVEDISVSGDGTLVAIGKREQIQVLEIPDGKTIYAGPGRFPRLSPDGRRLAFVEKEKLGIHSFADGSTVQLLKGKRVKGVGGWSPDGRFLLAGAWTTALALEKRQIIVDTTTGEYAVIGKLGEGDYGNQFAWISVKLLAR